MEREFIPYEQALALKELGFDEPCLAGFRDDYKTLSFFSKHYDYELLKSSCITKYTLAPLYQQAFRWFREKYNIEHNIFIVEEKNKYSGSLKGNYTNNFKHFGFIDFYDTYEEAELECLKKLIEIVKNK